MKHSSHNIPTIFIVFGATGDLMERKIVPAIYNLSIHKDLPDNFAILGFSRKKYSDLQFRNNIKKILISKKCITKKNIKKANKFLDLFHYQQGDFNKLDDIKNLSEHLERIDNKWGVCANKLFFTATQPKYVPKISKNLYKTKLAKPCGGKNGWSRIMVEKPIGKSLRSAKQFEKSLSHFKPEQVYRIDHYLAKQMVEGIVQFRFSNNLLEQSWNNKYIEKIEMNIFEDIGVEDRGAFYDGVGALRDVGQNHMLMMLSLLLMEHPGSLSSKNVHKVRGDLLKKIKTPSLSDIKKNTTRAQYRGYKKINGVKSKSTTETYFALQLEVLSNRWKGVPIILRSGKRMGRVEKRIIVTFKEANHCLCPGNENHQNKVVFSLHPHQGISIDFWAKKPGFDDKSEKRALDFMLYKNDDKRQYVEEYARLLYDAIIGEQTWFVSKQEVFTEWKAIDPIVNAWKKDKVKLKTYKPDTDNIIKNSI